MRVVEVVVLVVDATLVVVVCVDVVVVGMTLQGASSFVRQLSSGRQHA